MLNLKEQQNSYEDNLSADDILASIKKRLGLADDFNDSFNEQKSTYKKPLPNNAEKSNAEKRLDESNNYKNSSSEEVIDSSRHDAVDQMDTSYTNKLNVPNVSQSSNVIDDDFSFNLDFNDNSNSTETNANKAYRAYQNAMKSSSYDDVNIENDSSENLPEIESWDLSDDAEDIEDFHWNEDSNDEQSDDSDSQEDTDVGDLDSDNVYFLKKESKSQDSLKEQSSHEYFQDLPKYVMSSINTSVNEHVYQWCKDNLENVCRKIIKEELYKEKTQTK